MEEKSVHTTPNTSYKSSTYSKSYTPTQIDTHTHTHPTQIDTHTHTHPTQIDTHTHTLPTHTSPPIQQQLLQQQQQLLQQQNHTHTQIIMHQGPYYINVGGGIFHLSFQSLKKSQKLIECVNLNTFIDRDPHIFNKVLEYLRTGELEDTNNKNNQKNCNFSIQTIQKEFQFYNITWPNQCVNCERYYDPYYNTHTSCTYHPGVLQNMNFHNTHKQFYTCCKRPTNALGCHQTAHTCELYTYDITHTEQHTGVHTMVADKKNLSYSEWLDDSHQVAHQTPHKKQNKVFTTNRSKPQKAWKVSSTENKTFPIMYETTAIDPSNNECVNVYPDGSTIALAHTFKKKKNNTNKANKNANITHEEINNTQWRSSESNEEINKNQTGPLKASSSYDLTKTKMCSQFKSGKCSLSSNECKFAHSLEELRATDTFYKTKLCDFYINGHCKAGDNCRHVHDLTELRNSVSGPYLKSSNIKMTWFNSEQRHIPISITPPTFTEFEA